MSTAQPKTDRTRKQASVVDSKYKTEDGHQVKYFHSKAEAKKMARSQSCYGTVILCARNEVGDGWHMINRFQYGKATR